VTGAPKPHRVFEPPIFHFNHWMSVIMQRNSVALITTVTEKYREKNLQVKQ